MYRLKSILTLIAAVFFISCIHAQGLPPGWEYTVTGDNHNISVLQAPIINNSPIELGDYIGVFYINDQGGETCGGAIEWTGGSGVVISAFGDDMLSPEKDGFAYNEAFIFRIYSWCGEVEYTAVTPVLAGGSISGLNWVSNGLTSLAMIHGTGPIAHAVSGTITDDGTPLENIEVTFTNGVSPTSTDANGEYTRCVPDGWSGDITPVSTTYTFTPSTISLSNITTPSSGNDFSTPSPYVFISGTVTDGTMGLENVEMLVSGYSSVFTDSNGNYTVEVDYGWTGTIQPLKAGYTFLPPITNVVNINANQNDIDFVGTIQMFTVSGTIESVTGSSVPGVEVVFSNNGGIAITDASGAYSIDLDYGYTGSANPTLLGHTFTPTDRIYSGLSQSYSDHNYTATEQSVIISGYINDTDNGDPIEEVIVFFDNNGGTDTTNYEGYYTMELPYGWSGTVYPDFDGFTFSPPNRSYQQVTSNRSNQNFEGTAFYTPPGWNVVSTDVTHVISIPDVSFPRINGVNISIGDFIGVFYWDEISQTEKCGGYCEWIGNNSVVVYGDDASTSDKDGFYENEDLRWRIHKMFNVTDYEAIAQYLNTSPYISDGKYHTNALSRLTTLNADDLSVEILPEQPMVCEGSSISLSALAQGGSGIYEYAWSSTPEGFSSSQMQVAVSPSENTIYRCDVTTYMSTATDNTSIIVLDLPVAPEMVISTNSEVCIDDPGTITLTALGGSGDIIRWYVDNVEVATGTTITVESPVTTTTYCAAWENSCGVSVCTPYTIVVLPLPVAPVLVAVSESDVCINDPGMITLVATGGSGEELKWFANDVSCGTGSPLAVESPVVPTTYCAAWENSCGISECVSTAVTILPLPEAPDSLSCNRDGFCPQDDGDIILTVHGGSGDIVTWYEGFCGSEIVGTGMTITIPSPEDTTTYYASWQTQCGVSSCAEITVNVVDTCQSVHVVSLPAGWSGISSWVMPKDTLTENIFAPIINDLVIVKNLVDVYWPPYANTMEYWDTWDGYKIKVEEPVDVTFTGDPADVLTIDLDQGWSLIPVLTEDPVSATSLFSPLGENLIIVKSVASPEVYWPAAQFYSLQTLQPGKAYMMALVDPAQIDFAAASASKAENVVSKFNNPWNEVTATGASHVIGISTVVTSEFQSGDIIGVFNSNGLCVGAVEIPAGEQNLAITVYGDDATTAAIDGMRENETMQFRIWDSKSESEIYLETEFDGAYSSGANFKTDGLGAVKAFTKLTGQLERAMLNVNLYPVPAKEQLFVEVSVNSSYAIQVFTLSGRKLMEQNECLGKTILNTEALHPGMYMLRIKNDQGTVVRRFVIGE